MSRDSDDESAEDLMRDVECWDEIHDLRNLGLVGKRPHFLENNKYPAWFDPDDHSGGVDEDGAPWGLHPFYDYGPMPGYVGWFLLRRAVRAKFAMFYWMEITARNLGRPEARDGLAPSIAELASMPFVNVNV